MLHKASQSDSPSPDLPAVRFLIISDTHGNELPSSLPECDALLHCGDLTEDGSPESISAALQALGKVKAELRLVIAGNHDIALDKSYHLSQGGSEGDVDKAEASVSEAIKLGITYLSEGTHTFTISSGAGFTIYASPYTPVHGASGFQYPTNEDRYNPSVVSPPWATNIGIKTSIIPDGTDIVMTHGPPKYILDSTADGQSAGCEHLRRAIERVKPKLHCFGHIHAGYGAQRLKFQTSKDKDSDSIAPLTKEWVGKNQAKRKRFASLSPGSSEDFRGGKQTMCINAAMEGEEGVLENMPWAVDLELNGRKAG